MTGAGLPRHGLRRFLHSVIADLECDISRVQRLAARRGATEGRGCSLATSAGSCRSGPEGEPLKAIEAKGVPTFCGAGVNDAVAVVEALALDRPRSPEVSHVMPAKAGIQAESEPRSSLGLGPSFRWGDGSMLLEHPLSVSARRRCR